MLEESRRLAEGHAAEEQRHRSGISGPICSVCFFHACIGNRAEDLHPNVMDVQSALMEADGCTFEEDSEIFRFNFVQCLIV